MKRDRSASIGCTHGPPDRITRTCFLKRIITALMKLAGAHLDRQIVIQRTWSKAFYNASQTAHPNAPSKIRRLRYNWNVHDGPFHLNRWSFRSDGYAQIPYKRGVPPICKAFELEINLIDLFRHLPSWVSRFHPLLHSFLHPQRVWNRDLVERRRKNRSLNSTIAFFTFLKIEVINRVNLIAILS